MLCNIVVSNIVVSNIVIVCEKDLNIGNHVKITAELIWEYLFI